MKIAALRSCLLLFLFASSCSHEKKTALKHFDFDGLLDDQVSQLSQRARVLDKMASIKGDQSDTTFLPSSKGWESELEIFRQLEVINKPTYQNSYEIKDPVADTKSNLKIREYAAKSAAVPLVRFFYQDEFTRLRKIEASVRESNVLYTTNRVLTMEFEEDDGKPLLLRYSIQGFQKMPFSDTVRFSVLGQIEW